MGGYVEVGTQRDALTLVHKSITGLVQPQPEVKSKVKRQASAVMAPVRGQQDEGGNQRRQSHRGDDFNRGRRFSVPVRVDRGEWELWETETSFEARVQGEIEQDTKDFMPTL